MDKKQQLILRMQEEFDDFKIEMLSKEKQEIFDSYVSIFFYSEIMHYLQQEEITLPEIIVTEALKSENSFKWLIEEYLSREYASIDSYEAIDEFLYSLATDYQDDAYKYVACGKNVEEVSFSSSDDAHDFVEQHHQEGYDCVVEGHNDIKYV